VFEVWRLTEEVFAASDQAPCVIIAQMGVTRQHFAFRRVLKRDGALERFLSGGAGQINVLAQALTSKDTFLRGPLDELVGQDLPKLTDVALVRSGVAPVPGRAMSRPDGNAWWLKLAGDMEAYRDVPRSALLRVRYPDDFHHASERAQLPYFKPKLLISAKRSPDNPWRLKVALDTRGDIVPRESVYQVAPMRDGDLYALMAIFASTVATCYIDTYGTKLAYGRDLLRALPVPRRGARWRDLAKSGQDIADAARDPKRLGRALKANESLVRAAYALSVEAAKRLDELFSGFNAPEGMIRYPARSQAPSPRPSGPRMFGAVLSVEGDALRLWIPGVTPEDGLLTPLPALLPGWLCEAGSTFEILKDTDDPIAGSRYLFQGRAYTDPLAGDSVESWIASMARSDSKD